MRTPSLRSFAQVSCCAELLSRTAAMADAITQRLATMEASLGRTLAENRPTVATLHLEAAIVGIKQLPKDKSWGEEIKHWISMLEPMAERGWLSAADMSKIMDAMSAVQLSADELFSLIIGQDLSRNPI